MPYPGGYAPTAFPSRTVWRKAPVADTFTVLYVTDLLNDSDETLASACALAHQHGADIEVVHVVDLGHAPSIPDAQMGIQYRLEKLGRRLKSLRDRVRSILLFGSPEEVIAKRADDIKAKLIAFGSTGALSGGIQQKLIESVTRRVSCPVITITSKAG